MKDPCSIGPSGTQPAQAEEALPLTGNTPPVDQPEMDRRAAQQLLPTILRIATRRLGASEAAAADVPRDVEDA